jgi:hypothetical protein
VKSTKVLKEYPGGADGITNDEGRAMAELICFVAPGEYNFDAAICQPTVGWIVSCFEAADWRQSEGLLDLEKWHSITVQSRAQRFSRSTLGALTASQTTRRDSH